MHAFGHWHDADIGHADGLPMMQLTGRIVVIQQSKIQALVISEIELISGGNLCDWIPGCRPPWRIDIGDPMDPVAPDLNHQL